MHSPSDQGDASRDTVVPRIHANAMRAHSGPFDVIIELGRRVGTKDMPETVAEVSMSWEHLAAMVKALSSMVDAYEEEFGRLPSPESVVVEEEI